MLFLVLHLYEVQFSYQQFILLACCKVVGLQVSWDATRLAVYLTQLDFWYFHSGDFLLGFSCTKWLF